MKPYPTSQQEEGMKRFGISLFCARESVPRMVERANLVQSKGAAIQKHVARDLMSTFTGSDESYMNIKKMASHLLYRAHGLSKWLKGADTNEFAGS